jgi:hypothetical protein
VKVSEQVISLSECVLKAQNLPVTNLKGLVSRSPSDIFAIVITKDELRSEVLVRQSIEEE